MSGEDSARRLILLRHGLTAWNAESRFQGQADVELTEVGHVQAKAAAEALVGHAPQMLWTSDLSRAVQTAEYLAEATQLVPVLDDRLREIHVGDFQGLTHVEVQERYGSGPWDFSQYGGESEAEAGERMASAIADATSALPPGATGVVVAHGAVTRLGLLAFLGWPLAQVSGLAPLGNCCWVELVQTAGHGATQERWRLAAYNLQAPIS